ncbi:MAG: glycosyltransferase family 39 protein [Vallitalea sp.]|jgi:hypothetical protein|nr:glycosyltransferase family 39 protein [Vallitalea sp.]
MKRLEKLFDIYMIMFFTLVLIVNIYFVYVAKINILYIIPVSIAFGILYFITVKSRSKYFEWLLFLFALFNKLLMIFIIKTPPISDFSVLLNASKLAAVGNYSFKNWDYFARWEYQSGFVIYQGFLIKLFGENIMILKAINCLCIAFTTLLVYKIGEILFGEYAGKIAGLIHSVYIPLFIFAPVLTNQHIATVFYYLALYFIVKKEENKPYRKWIISGICLALGNLLRPIGIVFVMAICILCLFSIFKYDDKKAAAYRSIIKLGFLLASYFIIFYSVCSILIVVNITETGLKNNNPYWKFVTGLNEKTSGRFSFEDAQIIYNSVSIDELKQKEKDIIVERLKIPPHRMCKLLFNKVRYMWGDYEAGVFTFPHLLNKGIIRWGYSFDSIFRQIQEFEKMFYIIIICLVLYGLINYYKEKDQNSYVKLLYYIVTIYSGIHLLIEISFRYKYAMMGIIFILAGKGGELLITKINNNKNNLQKV